MLTYTGLHFWPLDPRPSEISIRDIARALSQKVRFAGQISGLYTVAQHSVYVADMVARINLGDERYALMHDAAEAYVGDMVTPLKRFMPEFKNVERGVMLAISERFFNIDYVFEPESVKICDREICRFEAAALFPGGADWTHLTPGVEHMQKVDPDFFVWSADHAEAMFLERFYKLFPNEKPH